MPSITVVDCGYVPIPPPSKPLQLNISAAFQYYCMKIQPRVDCNMILQPAKYYALNCKGGCAILITVVDCGMCLFAPVKTIAVEYLSGISILLHGNSTACRLLYDIETSQILRFELQRGLCNINYSVSLWYVPIPPLSKPLQLNISAAFQYYCMKIQPRVDCNMILKPSKYCASICKGGCAISITVVDCGMCQFRSLAVAITIKSFNQACCHNHHHHHLVSSPCS